MLHFIQWDLSKYRGGLIIHSFFFNAGSPTPLWARQNFSEAHRGCMHPPLQNDSQRPKKTISSFFLISRSDSSIFQLPCSFLMTLKGIFWFCLWKALWKPEGMGRHALPEWLRTWLEQASSCIWSSVRIQKTCCRGRWKTEKLQSFALSRVLVIVWHDSLAWYDDVRKFRPIMQWKSRPILHTTKTYSASSARKRQFLLLSVTRNSWSW